MAVTVKLRRHYAGSPDAYRIDPVYSFGNRVVGWSGEINRALESMASRGITGPPCPFCNHTHRDRRDRCANCGAPEGERP